MLARTNECQQLVLYVVLLKDENGQGSDMHREEEESSLRSSPFVAENVTIVFEKTFETSFEKGDITTEKIPVYK